MPNPNAAAPLLDFDYFRKTRSNKTFSPFSATPVKSSINFDLNECVSSTVLEQARAFWISDSPLTSPEPSPLPSRSPSPEPTHAPTQPSPCREEKQAPTPAEESQSSEKSRAKRRSHKNRQKKRQVDKARAQYGSYEVRDAIRTKYLGSCRKNRVEVEFDLAEASVAPSAFVGSRRREAFSKRTYTLKEILEETKFKLVEWDGKTPTPIVDKENRVVAVLVGHPDDPEWHKVHEDAAQLLEENQHLLNLPPKLRDNRRGPFPTTAFGVSHGGGRTKPNTRPQTEETGEALERITLSKPFQRLAGFLSAAFAAWAPKLYNYYVDRLGSLFSKDPSLKRCFLGSIFPAASYNFGPATVCHRHYDSANLPFGWCGITALGKFDSKTGGHLILWELGLIIEFPAGSTVFIPSAIIAHQNVSIREGETRYSFTQYAAGDLFRWVEHGFTTDGKYFKSLSPDDLEAQIQIEVSRWKTGVDMFPKLSDWIPCN